MTALLLTEVFPPQVGGSGRWLYEVYRRLPAERVVVAAGEYAGAKEFDRQAGLAIERLRLHFPQWGILEPRAVGQYGRTLAAIRRLVRERRVGAVHCGRVLPEGWLAWLLKWRAGLPYWVFVHGEELQYGRQSRQLGWMMRRVFARAEGVIANSHNTAALVREQWRVPAARVHVVHPGVDAAHFTPAPRDEALRASLGWQGRRVVLTVGRLQKRKGQDMLIRALPEIRRSVPDVLYAVAGDGEERESLAALAREAGVADAVQFLGQVDGPRLLSCYQQCDLFALPNREVNGDFEGFGMVLVEAQACGRPVLAGASGGTRETLCDGETGRIVPCQQPESLAAAVSELLSDPPRLAAMGAAARRWAETQFAWEGLAQRVGQIVGGLGEATPNDEPAPARSKKGVETVSAA